MKHPFTQGVSQIEKAAESKKIKCFTR